MSVEAMAVVLHHSKAKGTAKLVLLGIANHQGDGGAWPSVATLATYANVHPRKIREHIARLVGTGELSVVVQGGGLATQDDYTRPNLYTVQVTCPPWCDRTMNHRDTRKLAGRQLSIPVDKPPAENGRGGRSRQGGGAENGRGAPAENGTQTGTTNPTVAKSRSQVQTARASSDHIDASSGDQRQAEAPPRAGVWRRTPTPAEPPADELAALRAKLKADTATTRAREHGGNTRTGDETA